MSEVGRQSVHFRLLERAIHRAACPELLAECRALAALGRPVDHTFEHGRDLEQKRDVVEPEIGFAAQILKSYMWLLKPRARLKFKEAKAFPGELADRAEPAPGAGPDLLTVGYREAQRIVALQLAIHVA